MVPGIWSFALGVFFELCPLWRLRCSDLWCDAVDLTIGGVVGQVLEGFLVSVFDTPVTPGIPNLRPPLTYRGLELAVSVTPSVARLVVP